MMPARWRNRSLPSGCSPATAARSPARSRSRRTAARTGASWSARSTPTPDTRAIVGFTGPPGAGKSTLIGALVAPPAGRRCEHRRALGRPHLAVQRRRRARRPYPPGRALPRLRRLHPLDGDPRRARRARRRGAGGAAADGRRRVRGDLPRDRRRGPGGDRRRRPRRQRRAGSRARFGRLGPGAEGGRDGDPRRDRDQQGRPPARADGPARGAGRARARAARESGRCRCC